MKENLNKIRLLLLKNNAANWQFLVISMLFSISAAFILVYSELILNINFSISMVLFGLIQGLISYFFMASKSDAPKIFFSVFFTVLTYILAKYLLYEHYFDWYLTAYIDKSVVNKDLIFFYLKYTNKESLSLFFNNLNISFSIFDTIILIISIITSLVYYILKFDNNQNFEPAKSKRLYMKRKN